MSRFLSVLIVSCLVGTTFGDDATPADPKASIQKVLDDQVTAWNKRDLDGFMAGYWKSDKLTFYSGKDITSGWKSTLERYRKKYQGEGKEMGKLSFKDVNLQMLGIDHALVTGRWQLELTKEKVGGLFTLIMHKKDAGWRIVHDHTSS
jgi:ketosteroid isomerase-like protein